MNGLGNLGRAYGQHYGPTLKDPTAPSGIEKGIAGWRWIFIMEGLLTILIAFIGAFTIGMSLQPLFACACLPVL